MKYNFKVSNQKIDGSAYHIHFINELKGIDKSPFTDEIKKGLHSQVAKRGFEAKNGQLIAVDVLENKSIKTFLIVGLGSLADQELLRRASAVASRAIRSDKTKKYSVHVSFGFSITDTHVVSLVEGFLLTAYSFNKYKKTPSLPDTVVDVSIHSNVKERLALDAIQLGSTNCDAVYFARNLINESPSVLYPESFGRLLKKEFQGTKVKVQVHDLAWLRKNKMGGIIAVGQGSVHKPVLIEMSYKPARARRHIVLVGKGVTFDSGGLSIKVGGSMISMKMDMGGAAAVAGALKIISKNNANVQVTVLIPSVENMPDGNSYRVDDVLNMADGSTVEVNNTDAEGRLILADALYYGSQLKPDSIINAATLTGAIMVALGTWTAGLFTNNDKLANGLLESSVNTGEKLWRMPLDHDLADNLKSFCADQKNTGGPEGSSITAALFLEKFVKETPWAHLDIAGTMKAPDNFLFDGGAVGYGVRLLANYISNQTN